MKTLYPNLYELFAGYFHQDWPEDSPTATGIIERYLGESSDEDVGKALKELHELLSNVTDDEELANIVNQLGSYYNPQADGITHREWLMQVSKLLKQNKA